MGMAWGIHCFETTRTFRGIGMLIVGPHSQIWNIPKDILAEVCTEIDQQISWGTGLVGGLEPWNFEWLSILIGNNHSN